MGLSFRKANIGDAELLFNWTNDLEVRNNSLNTNMIAWDEHLTWLNVKLSSESCQLYVFMYDNTPIGQLRLDFIEDYCIVNYSVDSNYRGRGYGAQMIKVLVSDIASNCLLKALVKSENLGSIKVFERAGFLEDHSIMSGGELIRVFTKSITG